MSHITIALPRRTVALVVEATDHQLLCPGDVDRAAEAALLHATLQAMVAASPRAETFAVDFATATHCHQVLVDRLQDRIPGSLFTDLTTAEHELDALLAAAATDAEGVSHLQAAFTAAVLLAVFALLMWLSSETAGTALAGGFSWFRR